MLRRICIRNCYRTSVITSRFMTGKKNVDPYKVMGVDRNATDEEIRGAYLKKCKELHPDVNKSPTAGVRFMEVRDAYRIIQNSERRRDYDDIKKSSIRFSEAFKAAEEFGTNYTKTEDMIRKMGQKAYQHRHSYGQGPKSKEDILREDWETDHFERLNRKGAARAVGVDFEEPSPQQKEAIKRNIVFLSLLAAIGLILYFMDRTL